MYCRYIADFDKLIPFKVAGTAFTGKINVSGLAKGNKLEYILQNFCSKKGISDISDIKFPLAIPTVDINSGEVIYFLSKSINDIHNFSRDEFDDIPTYKYNGRLCSIVRASSSFPGVFEPKIIEGKVLVDGGVRVNTPASITRQMGADKVIAINLDVNKSYMNNSLNIVSVALKAFNIMSHEINKKELEKADIVISPEIPNKISLLDCSKTNYLVNAGYIATKKVINEIKELSN